MIVSLFTCVIEGKLTASPTRGHTRSGAVWVQFPIVHRERYRDATGRWVDGKAMFLDVVCWGALTDRVNDLVRGDQVVVEVGHLMAYENDCDQAAMKAAARNVSMSMRFQPAHSGPKVAQRRGDVVVTADGERIASAAYPERVADLELAH
ncbi:single-stranded DNA-binding protein [Pilimelia columellifera]|uniref:Single-stranded DNA-binding protein n=1 Tax=Pilimelia columellifera subsp. columellifera TaxID=706583 RepID=A0ABN3NIH5_9ACTN